MKTEIEDTEKLSILEQARSIIGSITMNDLREKKWLSFLRMSIGYLDDSIRSLKNELSPNKRGKKDITK